MALQKVDVAAKNRKIIWQDGKRLTVPESVQCVHEQFSDFPPDLIEDHLVGWPEMEFNPPGYSQDHLDELDRLTEEWADDHQRQVETRKKQARTLQS